jgi:hypothetical protein
MNNYKQITIYTSYAENSIQSVTEFKATSLQDAAECVKQHLQKTVLQSNPLLVDYVNEFFNNVTIVNDVAYVETGEENVTLVLPEGNAWYNIVDDEEKVYNEMMDEWCKLIDSQWDVAV